LRRLKYLIHVVGLCHYGMAPPLVVGGGTTFNMEGNCKSIE